MHEAISLDWEKIKTTQHVIILMSYPAESSGMILMILISFEEWTATDRCKIEICTLVFCKSFAKSPRNCMKEWRLEVLWKYLGHKC